MEISREQADKIIEVIRQEVNIEFSNEIDRAIALTLVSELTDICNAQAFIDSSSQLRPVFIDISDIRFLKVFRIFCNMIEARLDAINRNTN